MAAGFAGIIDWTGLPCGRFVQAPDVVGGNTGASGSGAAGVARGGRKLLNPTRWRPGERREEEEEAPPPWEAPAPLRFRHEGAAGVALAAGARVASHSRLPEVLADDDLLLLADFDLEVYAELKRAGGG